ncbi:MAG TPA: neutral zinc metallopeptidase [Jatrophihabitantaceae bacterium]|nr:neutral zinc metallopeptidase [Jatrophihabitantaceae bacterium]
MARQRWRRGLLAALLPIALTAGCVSYVEGTGQIGITVQGDSGGPFDTQVNNALSAVIAYWTAAYPAIAHGRPLPPLRGKYYSIDGTEVLRTRQVPANASDEKCLQLRLGFIIDNAAYCELDDSIVWDRSPQHLLPVLSRAYGPAVTALVFAHEFGHAIQQRLHVNTAVDRTIDVESQADCAAGAFAAAALKGQLPQFKLTPAALDRALAGYLQIRDSTPNSPEDISHGDGFDRLNALQQGIQSGASYCFSSTFMTNRTYTERGYVSDQDYVDRGNQPLAEVLNPTGIVADLNRFWATAASKQGKTFRAVKFAKADHLPCGGLNPDSELGYCADDNTVYYSASFAHRAYYSITAPNVHAYTGDVSLSHREPGDFALGTLFAIAWGMAGEHQLYGASTDGTDGLTTAVCYAGAYADDINRITGDAAHPYILSPPDMDEATSAVLELVGSDRAFSARSTTGLQRVQEFVKGYTDGLTGC